MALREVDVEEEEEVGREIGSLGLLPVLFSLFIIHSLCGGGPLTSHQPVISQSVSQRGREIGGN